jgi:hypothetical protein
LSLSFERAKVNSSRFPRLNSRNCVAAAVVVMAFAWQSGRPCLAQGGAEAGEGAVKGHQGAGSAGGAPVKEPQAAGVSAARTMPSAVPVGAKLETLIKERYMLYHQTLLKAGNFDELMPFRSAKSRVEMEKKMAEAQAKGADDGKKLMDGLFGLVKAMEPRNVKVESVLVNGDKAELILRASDSGQFPDALSKGIDGIARGVAGSLGDKSSADKTMRSTTVGKVTMYKEDGNWMVGEESWSTKVTNLTPAQEAKRNAAEAVKKGLSAWCGPAATMAFPQKPATGRLKGQPFVVEGADLSNGILTLRQGRDFFADRQVVIFIFHLDGKLDGQQIAVRDGEPVAGKGTCHVHMGYKVPGKDVPATQIFMPSDGYGIKLAFGQSKNGMLPGYIVLRLPDKEQSFVQGYFYAKVK